MIENQWMLIVGLAAVLVFIFGIAALSDRFSLNGIKMRTVGDGQHGTARWSSAQEIRKTYAHIPFNVKAWRQGEKRPTKQGLVLGTEGKKKFVALVDCDDIHCLMIGASGVGKTAYFL